MLYVLGISMFRDRRDAGQRLAAHLLSYANRKDTIVMALPRGGVPVAFEIAQRLLAPLDVLLVRKLGAPGEPELAMGAIASGGAKLLDYSLIQALELTEQQLTDVVAAEEAELERREQFYKAARPGIDIRDKVVILVDDGLATGASMLVAIGVVRSMQPKKIVVAVPVSPPHAKQEVEKLAGEVVCLLVTPHFPAVGAFYRDFSQTSDEEVRMLLMQAAKVPQP